MPLIDLRVIDDVADRLQALSFQLENTSPMRCFTISRVSKCGEQSWPFPRWWLWRHDLIES